MARNRGIQLVAAYAFIYLPSTGAGLVTSVMIDKKFPPQELAIFERGEMVNLDGYAKFRDGDSMKQFRVSIATIPPV